MGADLDRTVFEREEPKMDGELRDIIMRNLNAREKQQSVEAMPQEVVAMLAQRAQEKLDEVMRHMPLVVALVDVGKKDLLKVMKLAVSTFLDLLEGMEEEAERSAALRAKGLARNVKALQAAGFSEKEAFALTLATVKPVDYTSLMNSASESVKNASKAKNKN